MSYESRRMISQKTEYFQKDLKRKQIVNILKKVKKMSGGSCRDLRNYMDDQATHDAFAKLISGWKAGYKTIIERRREPIRCKNCSLILEGEEKFCPECGTKVEKTAPQAATQQQTQ